MILMQLTIQASHIQRKRAARCADLNASDVVPAIALPVSTMKATDSTAVSASVDSAEMFNAGKRFMEHQLQKATAPE